MFHDRSRGDLLSWTKLLATKLHQHSSTMLVRKRSSGVVGYMVYTTDSIVFLPRVVMSVRQVFLVFGSNVRVVIIVEIRQLLLDKVDEWLTADGLTINSAFVMRC
jgi:hypothetical protein